MLGESYKTRGASSKNQESPAFRHGECQGGCCGYNEFCANLLYERGAVDNPVIVKVEEERQDSKKCCETLVLTLFGESKPIAGIKSESGSGSGWYYGACVKLVCSTANLELKLTKW